MTRASRRTHDEGETTTPRPIIPSAFWPPAGVSVEIGRPADIERPRPFWPAPHEVRLEVDPGLAPRANDPSC